VTLTDQPHADIGPPRMALTAGIALLVMAALAPFAYFFVLQPIG